MKKTTLLIALLLVAGWGKAQSWLPELKLVDFADGFTEPLDIQNCGDSRLFIVEKAGRIWTLDAAGNKGAAPFLDISARVNSTGGEQGLLGLAFHPDYPNTPYFYVNYTYGAGNTRISRFRVTSNPEVASPGSESVFMYIHQPFANHNGGCLAFGHDGYLYIALGDGGSAGDPFNNAQDPNTLLGKMLRIDVNHPDTVRHKKFSIPPDNPFINTPGYRPEIWATGLRNPFRFSFDRLLHNMWIGDVGQNKYEEVNFEPFWSNGGKNYGWSCYEGTHFFKNNCDAHNLPYTDPVAEYAHSADSTQCATVIGGYVYRGWHNPKMWGKYFYNDYCSGQFSMVYWLFGWHTVDLMQEEPFEYVSFGQAHNGELYVCDILGGEIYHLIDSSMYLPRAGDFSTVEATSVNLYPNPNKGTFNVQLVSLQEEDYAVSITDLVGQEVYADKRTAAEGFNEWMFNTTQLLPGVYLLIMRSQSGTITRKFIVE